MKNIRLKKDNVQPRWNPFRMEQFKTVFLANSTFEIDCFNVHRVLLDKKKSVTLTSRREVAVYMSIQMNGSFLCCSRFGYRMESRKDLRPVLVNSFNGGYSGNPSTESPSPRLIGILDIVLSLQKRFFSCHATSNLGVSLFFCPRCYRYFSL